MSTSEHHDPTEEAQAKLDRTRIRFLTPDTCKIHLGNLGALHVTIVGESIYGGIYTAFAFPVGTQDGFISLLQVGEKKDIEIGVIRNLSEFPPEAIALVREATRRRYFIHTVSHIYGIYMKWNLLILDVDTDKGRVSFYMRWSQDRAVDYGKTGKVLIDVDDNRYLIPDVEALPAKEKVEFTRYIYW
jgi:ATP-binding cassette, subfamily B, bacterial